MREIVYYESAPGCFEPKPSRSTLRKSKLLKEKRQQKREEWQLFGAGLVLILASIALGAWQGHLMVMG